MERDITADHQSVLDTIRNSKPLDFMTTKRSAKQKDRFAMFLHGVGAEEGPAAGRTALDVCI